MVKKQKLYRRILNSQKNVKFNDFVTIILAFGFTFNHITGSHHIYDHPDVPQSVSIQPDKHNQAKPYQVRQFLRLVENFNLKLSGDEEETDE
jgi:predicted RNA binding protein YcfA (HicA-like mRNA interferase family)